MLVQDCNEGNIKKKKLEEYECKLVFDGLQPTAAKALYPKTARKIYLLKTDMLEYIVVCQLKKLCGLCQGTI